MSFIGNFAAAQSAKAIGQYNSQLYYQQAQYARKKAAINQKVYDQVTRPLIVKNNKANYSNFFVSALSSGAEFREGTSPYLAGLEFRMNQATDLVIADFNSEMDQMDQLNQASLLQARGTGAAFSGAMTARTENIKGAASLLSAANSAEFI